MLNTQQLQLKRGTKHICQDLTFNINPGEIWGILGPNGCGKTTLLHALAGLLPIANGQILLGTMPLKHYSPKHLAQHMGILFQDIACRFSQTVREFCDTARYPHRPYFHTANREDALIIQRALDVVELHDKQQRNCQTLSGGEKRRLAIAALLAQTPHIYVLDEPTNQLDIRHQIKSLSYFQHLAATQRASIIMATHDINLAEQFCSHILLLGADYHVQGKIKEVMTPKYLSTLYQHPLICISNQQGRYWQAINEGSLDGVQRHQDFMPQW